MAKEVTLYIDQNIPYSDVFFESLGLPISYFNDQDFDISSINEDAIVVIRSTYKTHNRDIPAKVNLICSVSTGEDHVDKDHLQQKGIEYAFSTGANAPAVTEYVLSSLALLLKNKLITPEDKFLIIGHGNIGSRVYTFLKNFGYSVDAYDPFSFSTIDNLDLLDQYKLISLHVPLIHDGEHPTYNLVDSRFLERMGDSTFIINSSRGGVVKEKDFIRQNKVRIITDVFENEPNVNRNFHNSAYLCTPHIAGHSQSARFEMTHMAYQNVLRFLNIEEKEQKTLSLTKVFDFSKQLVEDDITKYGLPVSLFLNIYNPKKDCFSPEDFKIKRDSYNNRIGYNQADLSNNFDRKFEKFLSQLNIKTSYN